MLDRIIAAEARPDYHIWVRFEDGLEGEVSVKHLVGRGVFASWSDEAEFQKLFVDPESGTVAWPGDIDLAPDALHERLAKVTPTASL
jgi:hypothetical protein